MNILVLNAGSSTLKFKLLALRSGIDSGLPVRVEGTVDRVGTDQAEMAVTVRGQSSACPLVAARSHADAAGHAIRACLPHRIDAIGHRVVLGGPRFVEPVRVTPEVVRAIREVSRLAPLHNGNALQGIEAALTLIPHVPAGAVFDTPFHRTMPDAAARYAIPHELADKHGLRRYGFHEISHRCVSDRLLRCLGGARGAAG